MHRTIDLSLGLADGRGRRVIAVPVEPRKRDFYRVLRGKFVPRLRVYSDQRTEFNWGDDFLFGRVSPDGVHSISGANEEMAHVREMANMPSPI